VGGEGEPRHPVCRGSRAFGAFGDLPAEPPGAGNMPVLAPRLPVEATAHATPTAHTPRSCRRRRSEAGRMSKGNLPRVPLFGSRRKVLMIEVELIAGLEDVLNPRERRPTPEYRPGMTVRDVLEELAIDRKSIVVALVNGRVATLDSELADGDRVRLIPPLGGG